MKKFRLLFNQLTKLPGFHAEAGIALRFSGHAESAHAGVGAGADFEDDAFSLAVPADGVAVQRFDFHPGAGAQQLPTPGTCAVVPERNLLFAGGVIGGIRNRGEGVWGERGARKG